MALHIFGPMLPPLPADETEAAEFFVSNFQSLVSITNSVEHAVALYKEMSAASTEQAKQRGDWQKLHAWSLMGARSAVLYLFGFSDTLAKMNTHLVLAPTLSALVKLEDLKSAKKVFYAAFPNIAQIRLDAAHPSELTSNKVGLRKHAARMGDDIDSGQLVISGSMVGDSYTATIKNQVVSVVINDQTVAALVEICRILEAAFTPIAKASEEFRLKQYQDKAAESKQN